MSTEGLVANIQEKLNRPDDDDMFSFPRDYHSALSQAYRKLYRKVARKRPEILVTTTPVLSLDGGNTFVLPFDHFGEMVLFREPGPPSGQVFMPALPEGFGNYHLTGRTVNFKSPYSGTLYVHWTPDQVGLIDADNDSQLPSYCDYYLIYEACGIMAGKPGFMGDRSYFEGKAISEWLGDTRDPSDDGILGIISNLEAYQGLESAGELYYNDGGGY